ncbi:MAG: MFS transporter [Candidatus Bathyarchaeia archaeon]
MYWKRDESFPFKWSILFVSFFAFVSYAFSFQAIPPLIPSIMEEFNISYAEAALMMSVVLVPGIFLSLPGGMFVRRHGVRLVGAISLIIVTLSSIVTATAGSFIMALIGRLILGFGGTLINTITPAIIAQWFTKKEMGSAMGIFGINMPFTVIISFPSATVLMLMYGWRFPFYISSAMGIISTAVFVASVREKPLAEKKSDMSMRQTLGNFEIWKIGLVWLFFSAAMSFVTWAPTLFEKFLGMTKVYASFLASLVMWASIFCVPLYGYISDKIGKRKLFAVAGSFLMTLMFILLAFTSNVILVPSIMLLGAVGAMIPPMVFTLSAEISGPNMASVGFGVTATGFNIGAALAQPIIGFILDITASYIFCLLGLASFAAVGTIVACVLKTG